MPTSWQGALDTILGYGFCWYLRLLVLHFLDNAPNPLAFALFIPLLGMEQRE